MPVRILCAQSAEGRRRWPETLRRAGFEVWEAGNAAEALERTQDRPDLVLLEADLPGRSSADVCRRIKTDPRTSNIPVLLLESNSAKEEASTAEADGYLSMYAEPREVLAWVRVLLQRQDAPRLESLGRLASGVAHDFNNLLTIILGQASLLEDYLRDGEARGLLGDLETAARSAADLAGQVLRLSRRQPLIVLPVALDELTEDTLPLLRRALGADVIITTRHEAALPQTRGVPGQLTQVLLNLCLNARDAMPNGGRLIISTETVEAREDTFVVWRISDTGKGISPESMPHIFEPFYSTRGGDGGGIGLATVQRIVREHGGWIECDSEPGHGSCFSIYLPRWKDEV